MDAGRHECKTLQVYRDHLMQNRIHQQTSSSTEKKQIKGSDNIWYPAASPVNQRNPTLQHTVPIQPLRTLALAAGPDGSTRQWGPREPSKDRLDTSATDESNKRRTHSARHFLATRRGTASFRRRISVKLRDDCKVGPKDEQQFVKYSDLFHKEATQPI